MLFADVVGFTTLSENRDPEQVKHLVDRCFQWLVADIVSFGGRVDKIIGDAVLALFGAPVAHEDDAERAVRAALRMQQTVTDRAHELDGAVRLRIGVNTGEVLVGALQAGGDYTAMGDVVNTANRLQTAARPGEVLVGESTHATTERVIPYVERGVVPAKGRDAPVSAWVARPPSSAPGERPNRTTGPLVGRDDEVSVLTRAASTALGNERAALLLLLGDAGMGKSRVAAEVLGSLACSQGAVVLEGRCLPYGEVNAWWPIADAMRSAIDATASDPLEVVEPRLRRVVSETTRRELDDHEVTRTANGLLQLFGFEESREGLDLDRAREEVVRSVVTFLDDLTRKGPVILWLSDLHWADDVVLELLTTALVTLARRPLVVLTTARRSLLKRWTPPVGRFDTFALNLEALDAAATEQLIDVLLSETDHEALGEAARVELRERSGGNPLFLVELLALLDDQQVAALDGGRSDSLSDMPDTLRGLVAARLDHLAPNERALIDDAAVLGRRGRIEHLAEMARQIRGVAHIDGEVAAVEARDLLRIDGDIWEFCSDLTREVAYRMLTKSDRAEKHLGVARWVEAQHEGNWNDRTVDLLAHHYGQAAELLADLGAVGQLSGGVRGRALHWIDEVSARGEHLRLLPAVERLCTQGLALADDEHAATRLTLLVRRARGRTQARDAAGASEDAAAAMELALELGDESAHAAVLVVQGDLAQQAGDLDRAQATLDQAVQRYAEAGDDDGRAEALRARSLAELFAGRTTDAERTASEAREVFHSLGRTSGEAWALQNLAWISFVQGRTAEAEHRIGESLELFGDLGDSGGAAWARGLRGFVRLAEGDLAGADELQRAVLTDARARWRSLGHRHDADARRGRAALVGSDRRSRGRRPRRVGAVPLGARPIRRGPHRLVAGTRPGHAGRCRRELRRARRGASLAGRVRRGDEPAGGSGDRDGRTRRGRGPPRTSRPRARGDGVVDRAAGRREQRARLRRGLHGGRGRTARGRHRHAHRHRHGVPPTGRDTRGGRGARRRCSRVGTRCRSGGRRRQPGLRATGRGPGRRRRPDGDHGAGGRPHLLPRPHDGLAGRGPGRRPSSRPRPRWPQRSPRHAARWTAPATSSPRRWPALPRGGRATLVGDGGAADLTAEAWARLHALGIDGAGWLTVFDLSLGQSAQVAPDPA